MATSFETKVDHLVHVLESTNYYKEGVTYGLPNPRGPNISGVSYSRQMKKWQAQIAAGGRARYLGLYRDRVEAQRAYDRACQALWRKAFETGTATQRKNYTPDLQVLAFGATL